MISVSPGLGKLIALPGHLAPPAAGSQLSVYLTKTLTQWAWNSGQSPGPRARTPGYLDSETGTSQILSLGKKLGMKGKTDKHAPNPQGWINLLATKPSPETCIRLRMRSVNVNNVLHLFFITTWLTNDQAKSFQRKEPNSMCQDTRLEDKGSKTTFQGSALHRGKEMP